MLKRIKILVGEIPKVTAIIGIVFMLAIFFVIKFSTVATETDNEPMKLGIIITTNDPETVFNALRLANFAINEGEQVNVFLLGYGVEIDQIEDVKFNVREKARALLKAGGKIMACGTCLGWRNSEGVDICPLSTMNDLYQLIKEADQVVTF